jgi:hypothetical protein
MHDEPERVTQLLDDVAARWDPRAHMDLSAVERHLAETVVPGTAARAAGSLTREECAGRRRRGIWQVLRRLGLVSVFSACSIHTERCDRR